MGPGFVEMVNGLRSEVKRIAKECKDVKTSKSESSVSEGEDRGEVLANLALAYRHLEDASMRFGKALQADGGVSVYDKETTVGA